MRYFSLWSLEYCMAKNGGAEAGLACLLLMSVPSPNSGR